MRIILFLLLLCNKAAAQDIVRWEFTAKKISDKVYELHIVPIVREKWHIYSLTSPDGAGMPTHVQFLSNPVADLQGTLQQKGIVISRYEKVFDETVQFLEGPVEFVQRVKLKAAIKTKIQGTIQYMACTEEQCTRPMQKPFAISLE